MVKCNFSNATSSRLKAYYPVIKERFAVLDLFFMYDNVFVYFLHSVKREHYLVVSLD